MKKVAIQGIKGSFHHQVAIQYFGNEIDLIECLTFIEMPGKLRSAQADVAIIAIENTIAGSLLPNYKLIDEHQLHIMGEVFLSIHHQLMALPGQQIEDLTEVHSHPMALQQCEVFFEKYPNITLVESKDTAESARQIAKNHIKNRGAIASQLASALYNLELLASDIHTYKNNTTRFFVVQNDVYINGTPPNKASLKVTLSHQVGSLHTLLHLFASSNINLTKIQSLPIPDKPFQYAFFIDVEYDAYATYKNCLNEVEKLQIPVKILGEYHKTIRL